MSFLITLPALPHSGFSPAFGLLYFPFPLSNSLSPRFSYARFQLRCHLLNPSHSFTFIFYIALIIIWNYTSNKVHCLFLPNRKKAGRAHNDRVSSPSLCCVRRNWGPWKLNVSPMYIQLFRGETKKEKEFFWDKSRVELFLLYFSMLYLWMFM